MQKAAFLILTLLLIVPLQSRAQQTIEGTVLDAETGETLPSAHVIIKDTYKGTITNQDGEFRLMVPSLPATIVVRFIGFQSKEVTITAQAQSPIEIKLEPSVADMGEIVVSGEDPAIAIMKEVIRRKKIWRADLKTYKAEAYTRQQIKNDTSIVSISESISEAYWHHEKGHREVLRSKRQTANLEQEANFAGVSYLPNFYDDNLDIAGFNMVGVTHPDALKFYTFYLEDILSLDGQVVYELSVTSNRKLQPLFEGTIYVLGEEYALLEVDLKPNSVVAFPAPVQDFNLTYSQQFSNFGGEFWLPVDVRIEGLVEVGVIGLRFPPIGFKQVAKLNDYEVNVELPDSLYEEQDLFSVDSTTINAGDSLFVSEIDVIPLDTQEQQAYENIDSTVTLEKAFRPTGFFTRFIDWDEESDDSGTTVTVSGSSGGARGGDSTASSGPSLWNKMTRYVSVQGRYNRVDALYGGLKHERRYVDQRISSELFGGYSIGYDEFSYGLRMGWWPLPDSRRFALYAGFQSVTDTRYNSQLFTKTITSIPAVLGYGDYFDYYRKEGVYAGTAYRLRRGGTLDLRYKYQEHSNIESEITNYDILGQNSSFRPNPDIDEGTLSAFQLTLSEGDEKKGYGAVGANDYAFSIEQSATFMGSDWNYTRFKMDVYRSFETFYQRRLFPNRLHMRLNAGTYLGDLPIQKNGTLDVAPGAITPFGAFRAARYIPYEGASYFALNAEHNFKSVPLELLGWRDAGQSGLSVIIFGGVGKSWIKQSQVNQFEQSYGYTPYTTENLHLEAGLSLSNIFNLFRADVAYRIDNPGIFLGVSIARFF
ncbi:DUF5686 and carboxypeptidase-like regulatory domain-containing protein [Gracilimonas mengyeensis]|uniref:CarboxypepD_reg-like domain-containing protein n=1 Tax=Gracilimonas mengyeensis TaxID=1302730 RepID=A0A521EG63_9BACT|nr:DUF5686 and carboxypeptidase-like regulatory domain-containing protein [Gracilimonas mengyeensis]SMO82852.1 CarboxypepD_reg-like domain-containing protein [Gracilimonas mengyeensis]